MNTDNTATPSSEKFAPERTHLLGWFIMTALLILIIGTSFKYLFWLLIFPVLFLIWILRSSTVVNDEGIFVTHAFSATKEIPWKDIKGIGFVGSKAYVYKTDGTKISMPGVTFNSFPKLEKASQGRIPDVLSAGIAAKNDKVRIVYKDGHETLIPKEEYERMQAEQDEQS